MITIEQLQSRVFVGWTGELYSDEFKGRACPYKDFDHALKHIRKAAQALENMTEFADHHADDMAPLSKKDISKYVADIIISAARLANVCPAGLVDLELALEERLKAKIDPKEQVKAKLEPSCAAMLDGKPCLRQGPHDVHEWRREFA